MARGGVVVRRVKRSVDRRAGRTIAAFLCGARGPRSLGRTLANFSASEDGAGHAAAFAPLECHAVDIQFRESAAVPMPTIATASSTIRGAAPSRLQTADRLELTVGLSTMNPSADPSTVQINESGRATGVRSTSTGSSRLPWQHGTVGLAGCKLQRACIVAALLLAFPARESTAPALNLVSSRQPRPHQNPAAAVETAG